MTQPPMREVVRFDPGLFSEKGKDGIAQGKDTANGGCNGEGDKRADACPEEEQPHAPPGYCFWQ